MMAKHKKKKALVLQRHDKNVAFLTAFEHNYYGANSINHVQLPGNAGRHTHVIFPEHGLLHGFQRSAESQL